MKIRIAVISLNGLSPGGVETFLRKVLCNLNKEIFEPTLFYCDVPKQAEYAGAWGPLESAMDELEASGVKVKKFEIQQIDFSTNERKWLGTNLFNHFREDDFDILLTGRGGNKQFPYSRICRIPIVDTIHLRGGLDLRANIMKSIHLNGENAVLYISRGGLEEDVKVISPIVENQILTNETYRNELNLNQKIVLGMHQRRDDKIFSEIPLKAFSNICAEFNIHFIILNGSRKYVEQAEELGIKEITFLPEALTDREKHRFLNTLDIFAHGRFDGETNSVALAEAMEHNLPIVTHLSEKSNGQREQVDLCGFFAHNETEYTEILRELVCNQELLQASSKASQLKFRSVYDLKLQISKIENELVLAYEKTRNKHGRILSYLKNFVKRRKKRFSYLVRKSTFAKRYGAQLNSLKLI